MTRSSSISLSVSTVQSCFYKNEMLHILTLQALYSPDIFPVADSGIFSKKFTGKSYIFSSFYNRKKKSSVIPTDEFNNGLHLVTIFSINRTTRFNQIRFLIFLVAMSRHH